MSNELDLEAFLNEPRRPVDAEWLRDFVGPASPRTRTRQTEPRDPDAPLDRLMRPLLIEP